MCEGIAENGRFRVVETVETQGRRKLLNDRPSFENPGHEAALSTLRSVFDPKTHISRFTLANLTAPKHAEIVRCRIVLVPCS